MLRIRSLLVIVSLLATSCAAGSAQETPTAAPTTVATSSTTTTTTSTTTTTIPTNPPSPLNGLPAEDPALLGRRVMAVKVDNHWDARPQSGLQEADAVFELLVEGGLTRLIVLFHDNDSAYVGPIRSVRPTDPTIVDPLKAPLAMSGGSIWILSVVRSGGTKLIGEGPGMFRIGARRAPHNLYGDTQQLREAADRRGLSDEPPPDLFAWGEFQAPAAARATEIELNWSNGNTVVWEWDGERYLRFAGTDPHGWVDANGEEGQVAVDTLVVLMARRYTASPPAGLTGTPVPASDTVGSGKVLVFAQGRVMEGTWARDSRREPFELTTDGGEPLTVPPGVPWVSIFPEGRSVSW